MSILVDSRTGPVIQADGAGDQPLRQGRMGALIVTDAHGRYFESTSRGFVYSFSSAGVNPTGAVPLGAAGTPIIAIYNPIANRVNLVLIQIAIAVRSNGTVAPGSFWLSGGPTAVITAAASVPINMLTLSAAGSQAKAYGAVALTGSSALLALRPVYGLGGATAATTATVGLSVEDTAGSIICAPGNAVALTSSVTGTGASIDAAFVWEEIPV